LVLGALLKSREELTRHIVFVESEKIVEHIFVRLNLAGVDLKNVPHVLELDETTPNVVF
jgi:hypothetical protein